MIQLFLIFLICIVFLVVFVILQVLSGVKELLFGQRSYSNNDKQEYKKPEDAESAIKNKRFDKSKAEDVEYEVIKE